MANRSLIISKKNLEQMSKTQQKKFLNSGRQLFNGDLITSSFLLGQIGKNYNKKIQNPITGTEILTSAYNLLLEAQEILNTKYIWLECENEPKLIKFYEDFGFKMIKSLKQEDGLLVMIMELKD